jgi:hypothetical protein
MSPGKISGAFLNFYLTTSVILQFSIFEFRDRILETQGVGLYLKILKRIILLLFPLQLQ